jgi:ectoine hydroxylase-related dioxygenase (phytanoyl-CoA dioxygenase family)
MITLLFNKFTRFSQNVICCSKKTLALSPQLMLNHVHAVPCQCIFSLSLSLSAYHRDHSIQIEISLGRLNASTTCNPMGLLDFQTTYENITCCSFQHKLFAFS